MLIRHFLGAPPAEHTVIGEPLAHILLHGGKHFLDADDRRARIPDKLRHQIPPVEPGMVGMKPRRTFEIEGNHLQSRFHGVTPC